MILLTKTTIRLDKPDNRDRIQPTLDLIGEVWKQFPNLNLTQVMQVVTRNNDLGKVTDRALAAAFKSCLARL